MSSSADPLIRELYALPPAEFTRARNARAAALRAAGHTKEARAVRALRRQPPALWATNRLAHVETERLGVFLDTVHELRRTQLQDPRAAADALRRQRAGLDALVSRAGQILAGHGHRATPVLQRRIANTLLGAAVDPDHARALREGRLTEELAAPGFEVLAGAPGGSHLRLVPPPTPGPAAEARRRQKREAARETGVPHRGAQREAQAEQERERRRLAAEELEREAAARRAAADAARREIEELTRQTRAARDRLRQAERAARAAAAPGRKARRGADGRPAKAPGDDRGEAGR
jgi:hypothetical protein